MAHKVFICHSSKDKAVAACAALSGQDDIAAAQEWASGAASRKGLEQ
jgi:hypothetical protein